MKRIARIVLPCALVLSACGSPYAGYKEVDDDVHLRLITIGDGERSATDSDSVHIRFRIAHLGEQPGSFLSTERWYATKDLRSGAMLPVLRRLHEGDSMSIIAQAATLPIVAIADDAQEVVSDTAHLQMELALMAISTPAMMRASERRFRRDDPEGFERRLIGAYLAHSKGSWTRWGTSDMHYIITGVPVDTNRVQLHQTVTVAWTGSRLEDGLVFDNTLTNGSSFTFRYGDPDQVMKGVETAVSLLREGQEGRFIVPSSLAFGARGIPGALDPWTPVLYVVRLEAVQRHP